MGQAESKVANQGASGGARLGRPWYNHHLYISLLLNDATTLLIVYMILSSHEHVDLVIISSAILSINVGCPRIICQRRM